MPKEGNSLLAELSELAALCKESGNCSTIIEAAKYEMMQENLSSDIVAELLSIAMRVSNG